MTPPRGSRTKHFCTRARISSSTVPFIEHGLMRGEAVLIIVNRRKTELLEDRWGGDKSGAVSFADLTNVGSNPALLAMCSYDTGALQPGVIGHVARTDPLVNHGNRAAASPMYDEAWVPRSTSRIHSLNRAGHRVCLLKKFVAGLARMDCRSFIERRPRRGPDR
jgi:hypothetical protein